MQEANERESSNNKNSKNITQENTTLLVAQRKIYESGVLKKINKLKYRTVVFDGLCGVIAMFSAISIFYTEFDLFRLSLQHPN